MERFVKLTSWPLSHSRRHNRHTLGISALALATITLVAACTPAPTSAPIHDPAQEIPASSTPPEITELTDVTFALDWTPNTNHIGVYVARELGYFEENGLDVTILPYQDMPIPDVIDSKIAEFGIADQTAVQVSRTAGMDVLSVFQVTQTETGVVVYLGDRSDITRPADLDGMVFGGFDSPVYSQIARSVIRGDGGSGQFTEIELNTGTYDALSSGEVDFTLSIATWENILLEMAGTPYGTFKYQDYGMPDVQTIGIISSDEFVNKNPETVTAFVQAVQRGYEYTTKNPADAAKILIAANPEHLADLAELTEASAIMLATEGYLERDGHPVGTVNPALWQEYGQFLHSHGFLVDASGEPVAEVPEWDSYYTEQFLTQ